MLRPHTHIKGLRVHKSHTYDFFFGDGWDRWIRYDVYNSAIKGATIAVTQDHVAQIKAYIVKEGLK